MNKNLETRVKKHNSKKRIQKKESKLQLRRVTKGEIAYLNNWKGYESGIVRYIPKAYKQKVALKFKSGEILVSEMTDPATEIMMEKSKAVITDRGGDLCHAAIYSKERGIDCIVGTNNATKKLKEGQKVWYKMGPNGEGEVYVKKA